MCNTIIGAGIRMFIITKPANHPKSAMGSEMHTHTKSMRVRVFNATRHDKHE
jgi:hypothetical protein